MTLFRAFERKDMSTEKREKKRKLNSRPEIDSFSTANETAEVPINTTDNLTTKKKRKVAEAEISVKDGSAGVQGTDGEGDVKTKRKQEKKGSKQSDTQPPHGISDTTATNEVTRLGADVAAPENDKKKQKSKKEKKGNKKSDAETNNVSKASAVDGSATERVEGNETEGDNKPKKKKKDKKSRSQSDDAVLGDTESGNDNISQKKRKRTTDEEPDNTVDASDKASKSDGPTPDQTAEPAKKKAKRKKKTQKPRPKTKTKPTAVQKLKQRQSMREKLLAKEINGVTSQPPDAESEAADGATKAQNPDTSVKKPVSIAPTSGPGESKRRQAAAEYLRLFVHDRKEWKFQKVRQVRQLCEPCLENSIANAPDM